MRGRLVLMFSVVLLLTAFAASAAEVVVLKDGRTIALAKPYVVKGKVAILTLPDKTVLSVPVVEIDAAKTAEAKARPAPAAPAAAAGPARPLTPAEAAKVKNPKKSVVSLTDDTVAHPATSGPEGTQGGDGGSRVELGPVTVKREKGGYSITGSLMNTGKAEAIAVTLTVEALGDNNQAIASGFANIAKDTLTAGEKTTFTAEIQTEAAVTNFNYAPRWKEKAPSRLSIAGGTAANGGQQGAAGGAAPEGEAQPAPPPAKSEEAPKPIPRADIAPPMANAPVGAPSEPGGTYVPQPSPEGQPHPPQ